MAMYLKSHAKVPQANKNWSEAKYNGLRKKALRRINLWFDGVLHPEVDREKKIQSFIESIREMKCHPTTEARMWVDKEEFISKDAATFLALSHEDFTKGKA